MLLNIYKKWLFILSKTNKKYQIPIELTFSGYKIGKEFSEKVNKILNYASDGLGDENRKIMYECLNLINERLSKLCGQYDSAEPI